MNVFRAGFERMQAYAYDPDPLVEQSNWVALTIGTHLPLWPFYIWWAAGSQAWPSSIWTIALTPVFLLIPLLARRNGLWGRILMIVAGIANTLLTRWALGPNVGTELFLLPCAVLAAILFRKNERWLMVGFSTAPLLVWYFVTDFAGKGLHHYDPHGAHGIFTLNVISISVLVTAFGWFQGRVYERLAQHRRLPATHDAAATASKSVPRVSARSGAKRASKHTVKRP